MTDAKKREKAMRLQRERFNAHHRVVLPKSQENLQRYLMQLQNVEREVSALMSFAEDGQKTFSGSHQEEFQQKLLPLKEWLFSIALANENGTVADVKDEAIELYSHLEGAGRAKKTANQRHEMAQVTEKIDTYLNKDENRRALQLGIPLVIKGTDRPEESQETTSQFSSTAQNTWSTSGWVPRQFEFATTSSSWQQPMQSTDPVNALLPPPRNPFAYTSQGFGQVVERDAQNLRYPAPMCPLGARSSVVPDNSTAKFVGAVAWNYSGRGPPQVRQEELPKRASTWTRQKEEQMMKNLAPLVGLDTSSSSGPGLPEVTDTIKSNGFLPAVPEPEGSMRSTLGTLPTIGGSSAKPAKADHRKSGASGREPGMPLPPLELSGAFKGSPYLDSKTDRRNNGKTGKSRHGPKTVR